MMTTPGCLYDSCYKNGYRSALAGYELARWKALDHFIATMPKFQKNVASVLDYGSGNGLFLPLWQTRFPAAELFFADVSAVALQQLAEKYPAYQKQVDVITNNKTSYADAMFDVVVSVEVMEHVENLDAYLQEIYRVLRPHGYFIWTTPCANRFSIEHIYNYLHNTIQPTPDGYRRWKREDPTHLRRLRTEEIKQKLIQIGYQHVLFRFRAHFFSFVCTQLQIHKILPAQLANKLMEFDYRWFRTFSNGASMLGCAQKD